MEAYKKREQDTVRYKAKQGVHILTFIALGWLLKTWFPDHNAITLLTGLSDQVVGNTIKLAPALPAIGSFLLVAVTVWKKLTKK